jgi:hypothetical protein
MSEECCEVNSQCDCRDETALNYGPWLWTAYQAHHELLKEKLKAKFESVEGPWLDQVSGLLVDMVNARWEGGRKMEEKERELRQKLDKLLAE